MFFPFFPILDLLLADTELARDIPYPPSLSVDHVRAEAGAVDEVSRHTSYALLRVAKNSLPS